MNTNKEVKTQAKTSNCKVVEVDVMDYPKLRKAIEGQGIVYINLAGDKVQVWTIPFYGLIGSRMLMRLTTQSHTKESQKKEQPFQEKASQHSSLPLSKILKLIKIRTLE